MWASEICPEMHALAKMAEMAINRQNRHFRQNRQPPRGHFWHPIQIARGWWFFASFAIACMAIFAKIANFAKIASLQGATFGIQFKSPAAGYFSPVSPFSPLHAFLEISGASTSPQWHVHLTHIVIETSKYILIMTTSKSLFNLEQKWFKIHVIQSPLSMNKNTAVRRIRVNCANCPHLKPLWL